MNSTKKNSEFGGVKKKLTAAIAMLLVATIMMVSSTYAWFTLSTAPEVTGITTSVGANGNLEMALLTKTSYADTKTISSAVGDSSQTTGKSATTANITWGNLVDLGNGAATTNPYGLDKITLNPARLNTTGDTTKTVSMTNPLSTPTYGNDGRVIDLSGTTYTSGTYESATGKFKYLTADQDYGVRAIGMNANLTDQEAGLLSAKSDFTKYMTEARSGMSAALATNGQNLANAVVTMAIGKDNVVEAKDADAIKALITAANDSLTKIEKAYKEVAKAALAAGVSDANTYKTAVSAVDGTELGALETFLTGKGATMPESLKAAIEELTAMKAAVTTASTKANATDDPDYAGALKALVDASKVNVNSFKAGKSPDADHDNLVEDGYLLNHDGGINSKFASTVINQGGASVEMPYTDKDNNSGVFSYIGSVAGNYSAMTKVTVNYGGVTFDNINATLKTVATEQVALKNALTALKAANSTGGTTYLSDTFGYAVDLAFRTNASGSFLMLATDGMQRIYDGSTNDATMGGGSTMTFKNAGDNTLTAIQIANLMSCIRVVFVNPADGTIYGVASLDNIAQDAKDATAMTGKLTLKDYTFAEGKLTLTAKAATEDVNQKKQNAKLVDMEQNNAVKVTAIVYLDGDFVDNSMVANAAQSITGTMNLQFSSNATLKPMDYTPLKNGTATANP